MSFRITPIARYGLKLICARKLLYLALNPLSELGNGCSQEVVTWWFQRREKRSASFKCAQILGTQSLLSQLPRSGEKVHQQNEEITFTQITFAEISG